MAHQLSDRELINRLSQTAFDTGKDFIDWINSPCRTRSREHLDRIKERTFLETVAVDRLIRRQTKLDMLRAEVKDLKRQLQVCGEKGNE